MAPGLERDVVCEYAAVRVVSAGAREWGVIGVSLSQCRTESPVCVALNHLSMTRSEPDISTPRLLIIQHSTHRSIAFICLYSFDDPLPLPAHPPSSSSCLVSPHSLPAFAHSSPSPSLSVSAATAAPPVPRPPPSSQTHQLAHDVIVRPHVQQLRTRLCHDADQLHSRGPQTARGLTAERRELELTPRQDVGVLAPLRSLHAPRAAQLTASVSFHHSPSRERVDDSDVMMDSFSLL